ncbi:hypothetical protein Pan216_39650 [Planctomycetes bacterium Pan216]|uniref:Thioredoxin domain-containing protein n=1 Tax=Kolteria novifilia TaxID=2527975 RepID=A0A518B7Y8_9BACT|nr:hypothetical protein Pan216_39650 [Planctomycetes bacterium Pan216]
MSSRTFAIIRYALFAMVAGGLIVLIVNAPKPSSLPAAANLPKEFGTVPPFALTERDGRTITEKDLAGRVAVVGFIFTRCHESCPMVTGVMAQLRQELPSDVQFISISVDPRYDKPEVLRQYASNFKADPERWWFLTGERDPVYSLIRDGFKVGVAENPDPKRLPGELVSHTTRLAVVDGQGHLRGYFDTRDPAAIDLLKRKVGALRDEENP